VNTRPGSLYQQLEQTDAFGRQLDLGAGEADRKRPRIEREVSGDERPAHGPAGVPPVQRGEAGLDLLQREGLDQVVVGAQVEALELVLESVARGQHQDRSLDARLFAQLAAQRCAVHARKAEVEQDRVEGLGDGEVQAGDAVGRGVHRMTARFEKVVEIGGDRRIVLDDQNAHGACGVSSGP
jgi:hypothetical protein